MSFIRKRLTYANVAMTLALVFAMSGGAFAAKRYLITSTNQISPKVLKHLTGKVGLRGPAGPVGPAGPAGPAGSVGAKGETGSQGVPGEPGKQGETGKEGSPWVDKGKLPKGSSESGQWGWRTQDRELAEEAYVPISFGIPLEAAPEAHFIGTKEELAGETHESPAIADGDCKGSFEHPEAASGNLCVFAGVISEPLAGLFVEANFTGMTNAQGSGEAGPTGTLLGFHDSGNEKGYAFARGTWVVAG